MNKTLKNAIELGKKLKKETEEEICVACNGLGYYDDDYSPPCGSCNGTGYVIKDKE
jgi:DnaJ-class molecular chaperone